MNLELALSPLKHFLLGVMVFLPLCFAVWYGLAIFHLAPLTLLIEQVLLVWMPDAVLWLKLEGHYLVLATNFGISSMGEVVSPPQGVDALGYHINPLVYSYGLPLYCALTLATPQADKWSRLFIGAGLLLLFQLVSMLLSILKRLAFDVGLAFQQQQAWSSMTLDAVAMAYQLATLLLPMVLPLIIWLALHANFVAKLAPQWQVLQQP